MPGTEVIDGDLGLGAGLADAVEAGQLLVRGRVVLGELEDEAVEEALVLADEGVAVLLLRKWPGIVLMKTLQPWKSL